jgi:hypothetical protein
MSNYTKLATEAGDQYLSKLAEGQEQFLKTISTLSTWAPPVSPMPTPAFAADLPSPRDVAEANFAFAAKLLKQQKAFADKLFTASTPAS